MSPGACNEGGLRERAEAVLLAEPQDIHQIPPEEIRRLVHELDVHQVELELQNEELRRTQAEVLAARDRFAELYDFAPVGYVTVDARGTIREANLTAARLLGVDRALLLGSRLTQFVAAADQDNYHRHHRQTLFSTLTNRCEIRLEAVDESGEDRFVELQSAVLSSDDAATRGCRTALLDITDRKRAEQQRDLLEQGLLERRKTDAIGQLAGGVAHDFNNILTVVLGNADMARKALLERLPENDPVLHTLDEIDRAGHRAAELTKQLLVFGGRQVVKPVILNVANLLSGMENMLRRLIREDIALSTECDPGLWPVRADPAQFEQVLANLILNARDALPRGGKISVRVSNLEVDAERAEAHADLSTGPHLVLTVCDDGVGVDDTVIQRIFEPFFTTKGVGKGIGMGLASAHGIVRQARGHIEVESELGRGATFRVYWPALPTAIPTKPPDAPADDSYGGTETVLLCEDESAIRGLVARVLGAHGYNVLVAADASEALRLAESHAGPIQLLISDIVMPGMNGHELAISLSRTHPGLRVLLISGHGAEVIGERPALGGNVDFMQKPFSPNSLLRRIRQVLDIASEV